MTNDEAAAFAYRLMMQTDRIIKQTLDRSAPLPAPVPKAPEMTKNGVRRIAHVPRGQGRRRLFQST